MARECDNDMQNMWLFVVIAVAEKPEYYRGVLQSITEYSITVVI